MDFLKSAVASIAKGPAFPYNLNDRVDLDQSIWTLQNGTKREDGSRCSIFTFNTSSSRSHLPLAKNALRKFKTLRHPGILKVLETFETDQVIMIATERVTPLNHLSRRSALSEESLKWGLYNVAKTVKFINDEGTSIHGNLRASSIFVSESGEWKVGGLEILSSMKEDDAVMFSHGGTVPDIARYSPPEITKSGWDSVRRNPIHAVDAYDYGILVSEVLNGGFSGIEQIGSTNNVPLEMHISYKKLTHAAPKLRLSVAHFLEQGKRNGGFFDTPLIQLTEGVENLGLKTDTERDMFFSELESIVESDDIPGDFFTVKVLPELLKSVEFGGGGPKSLGLIMRIGSKLVDDEYDIQITPVVVRLFMSPDRALRVCLLDNLPLMIDHLNQKLVTDKIFPQIATGFGDLAPVVREQTVKAVLVVVPKLSDRVINGELLRHLAKTANDEQPGIRTNTTICLGKIAKNLAVGSRGKVLSAAFSRALRDPFVHARNAALMALAATVEIFSEDDCATRMLPAICPCLVDKEKLIRDQANKTLNVYLERVRKYSASLPNTALPPSDPTSVGGPQPGPPQPSNQMGSQWMGWAISSFTNKLSAATGEIQSNGNDLRPSVDRSNSSPMNGHSTQPALQSTASAPVVPKVSSNLRTTSNVDDAEDDEFNNGWGNMDEDDPSTGWEEEHQRTRELATHNKSSSASVNYDDGGEPDFEGWLNAQAQAKATNKKALPKGLTKKTTPTKPAASTRSTALKGASSRTAAKAVSRPIEKQNAAAAEEDDDWGDAWG